MRDEKRIDRILNKIEKAWKRNPDLRFGQLLINMCLIDDTFHTWNREDNITEEILKQDPNGMIGKRKRLK